MTLRVVAVGPLATIQDPGRPGHGAIGVPRGGAVDRGALTMANRLVGNPDDAAGLEVLLGGLGLRIDEPVVVALAGAPVPVRVDGRAVDPAGPIALSAGAELVVGRALHGLRSYLAVRGGIVTEQTLGSASSSPTSGLGPSPLAVGDRLRVGAARAAGSPSGWVDADPAYRWGSITDLRVVLGPRDDWFTVDALETLRHTEWEVSADLDRVGVRLSGPALARSHPEELPSEGIVAGAVQVPPSGHPIIFLADHPTTGGYPVIAVVVDADLDRAGQLRPGDRVRFSPIPASASWPPSQTVE